MTEKDAYSAGYSCGVSAGRSKTIKEMREKVFKLKISLSRDRDALIYNIAIKEVLEMIK
jgi:hypothetical protein